MLHLNSGQLIPSHVDSLVDIYELEVTLILLKHSQLLTTLQNQIRINLLHGLDTVSAHLHPLFLDNRVWLLIHFDLVELALS